MNLVDEIKEIVKLKTMDVPSIRNELQRSYPEASPDSLLRCILLIAEIDPELILDKSKSDYKFNAVGLKKG